MEVELERKTTPAMSWVGIAGNREQETPIRVHGIEYEVIGLYAQESKLIV
jgi:hypothetical protein